jgi:imidazolonepropionase-like amidohydrolase
VGCRKIEDRWFLPGNRPAKSRRNRPADSGHVAKAYKAGVKIAFGTDTGVSAHGDNAREFQHMVEAGMTALSAIRAATIESATLLGIEKTAGIVDVGKWADIVATPDDPTQDITTMQRVSFVMKWRDL